jgi:hypothetical protein
MLEPRADFLGGDSFHASGIYVLDPSLDLFFPLLAQVPVQARPQVVDDLFTLLRRQLQGGFHDFFRLRYQLTQEWYLAPAGGTAGTSSVAPMVARPGSEPMRRLRRRQSTEPVGRPGIDNLALVLETITHFRGSGA